MSNDLISREKTIFFICDVLDRYRVDVGDKMAKALIDSVKAQPTAYDVDKVVERLENAKKIMMPVLDYEEAIKIVKSAGIE